MENLELRLYRDKYPLLVDEGSGEVFIPYYTMEKVRAEGNRNPFVNFVKELKKQGYRKIRSSNILKAAEANIYAEEIIEEVDEIEKELKEGKSYIRNIKNHALSALGAAIATGLYALLNPVDLISASVLFAQLYGVNEILNYDLYQKGRKNLYRKLSNLQRELFVKEYLAEGVKGGIQSYRRVLDTIYT